MVKINPLIEKRLEEYPREVVEVAIRAIELSDQLDEANVVQALHQIVRQIVRREEE